jgi:FkbM family methyltransferase
MLNRSEEMREALNEVNHEFARPSLRSKKSFSYIFDVISSYRKRLAILYNWLFIARYDVSLGDILYALLRSSGKRKALSNVESIENSGDNLKVRLKKIKDPLFWPKKYNAESLYLVVGETFDTHDWHFYEHPVTPVGKNDVVLDLGAAEGLFSLKVINRCMKVFLIEPNPSFLAPLRLSFAPYLESGKATIINCALGNTEGVVHLHDEGGSSTVGASGIECTIRKLDTLFEKENKIDFIKADVEGFELEIFKGAATIIRKHRPKIATTCYHEGNDHVEIISFIKSLSPEYKVFRKGITRGDRPKPMMLHFYCDDETK